MFPLDLRHDMVACLGHKRSDVRLVLKTYITTAALSGEDSEIEYRPPCVLRGGWIGCFKVGHP